MTTTETDARRFRLLQILDVEVSEQVHDEHVLDTLRGFHFSVTDAQLKDDVAWLDDRGFIRTGPCAGGGVWLSLLEEGRQVVDLASPGPALRSMALGHGVNMTTCGHPELMVSAATLRALRDAGRELVRALLDRSEAALPASPRDDAHLGAREAS